MKILFITIAWPQNKEKNLYSDLMHQFVKNGHRVYVLYSDEKAPIDYTSVDKNFNVLHVKTSRIRKAKKVRKAFALFLLGKSLKDALFNNWAHLNFDLIIAHSPPITLSKFYKVLKRKFNIPIYFLLKDIWPDGPADLKIIRKGSIIYKYFRHYEVQLYKTVDYIGCMSRMNVEYILNKNKFLTAEKVEVCPNTITPRRLSQNIIGVNIREKFKIPEDAVVFLFSGNLGKAHGLSFFIDAIEALGSNNKAYFLIGGSGLYFNFVEQEIKRRKLTNIRIYQRLPIEYFDQVLLSSDVGIVLLDSNYKVPQFPSRILSYMEAKKPIFCIINKYTDIGNIIEEENCGLSIVHGDLDNFIKSVKFFLDENNKGVIKEMGKRSFQLLNRDYTSSTSYRIIMKHFDKQTRLNSNE